MKKYSKPYIEVLLFDEEDIETTSTTGYTATEANTYQMGQDAEMGTGGNVSISTVKITSLDMD